VNTYRLCFLAAAALFAYLRCSYPDPAVFSPDAGAGVTGIDVVIPVERLSRGETARARCLLLLPDGTRREADPGTVGWVCDNLSVATVDIEGIVTAIDGGSAKIRAGVEGFTAERTLTVTVPPDYSMLLISEAFYDSKNYAAAEFIELWNAGVETLDISGFLVIDASGKPRYTIAHGTTIYGNRRLVIPRETASFREEFKENNYPDINLLPQSGIVLGNYGETLLLYHPDGNLQDELFMEGGDITCPAPNSWGDTSAPNASAGYSAHRMGPIDTNSSADWSVGPPSPGE